MEGALDIIPAVTGLATLADLVTYFGQSNLAGKVIVLLLLLFSIIAWTTMLGKFIELTRMQKQNRAFQAKLTRTGTLLRLDPKLAREPSVPYVVATRHALEAYRNAREGRHAISHMVNALQRAVAVGTARYDEKMNLLSSIVAGVPFLGLFGTVWGVMDAFGSITAESGANIAMLAPGVSGALLTTVAALFVAIPSVFGYNFLLTQTRAMTTDLENFASQLADQIELEHEEMHEAPGQQ